MNPKKQLKQDLKDNTLNQSVETSKTERRAKDLENLNRNLMKKLYADLYVNNIDLYQEKNLTFENFLYHFYRDFESLLDFENPDYKLLLGRMDLIVKSKFDRENRLNSGKNKLEILKELNYLSKDDEWALIDKYRQALYEEEEAKLKKEKKINHKKYLNDLDNQINERKNYVDPIEKKKAEIYLFKEKEEKKKLEQKKIENQEKLIALRKNIINYKCILVDYLNKLEKENFDINENNKDIISYKIDYLIGINNEKSLDNVNLPIYTEQIINEKNLDTIKKGVAHIEYQKELINQMDYAIRHAERPSKMSIEERKINKDLLEEAKKYFNQKYKLSY